MTMCGIFWGIYLWDDACCVRKKNKRFERHECYEDNNNILEIILKFLECTYLLAVFEYILYEVMSTSQHIICIGLYVKALRMYCQDK